MHTQVHGTVHSSLCKNGHVRQSLPSDGHLCFTFDYPSPPSFAPAVLSLSLFQVERVPAGLIACLGRATYPPGPRRSLARPPKANQRNIVVLAAAGGELFDGLDHPLTERSG